MNLISKIAIGVSIPVMIIVGLSFGLQMYDKMEHDAYIEKELAKELFGTPIQRQQVADFEDCKVNGFQEPQCAKWIDEMQLQECRENKDTESSECWKYRM